MGVRRREHVRQAADGRGSGSVPAGFSKAELRLAAELLDQAADSFSNHGCNDFNIAEYVPARADRDALVAVVRDGEDYDDDDFPDDERDEDYRLQDWELMRYLASRFASAAE